MKIPITQMLPLEPGRYVALYSAGGQETYTEPVFAIAAYGSEMAPVTRSGPGLSLAGVKGSDPAYGAFLGLFTPTEASNEASDIAMNGEDDGDEGDEDGARSGGEAPESGDSESHSG
ncbi:hypothetical protein ACFWIB_11740 [Streptomyces sp. NPDC127051]|uniref:hypothetical protein n=1 Tax=Streptomyces sp. NPDC127051 TaxID=3347119 RepID=UPI003658AA49